MRAGIIASALVMLLVSGCGEPKTLKPERSLMKFQIKEMRFLQGSGELLLKISNPNPDEMLVEGLRVKIISQREVLAEGMTPVNQSIAGYGSKDIIVPVTVSNLSLIKAAGKLLSMKNKISYSMDVKLTVMQGGESGTRRTFNIDRGGSIPLALPKLSGLQLKNAFQEK